MKNTNNVLVIFFALSFAMILPLVAPGILNNYKLTDIKIPFELLVIIGSWTPNFAAFIVIVFVIKQKGGIKELFKRWLMFRASVKWYVAAISPLFVAAVAGFFYFLFDGVKTENPESVSLLLLFAMLIMSLITGAMGEELGWRGFALPRLQSKFNAFWASTVLGVLWGFWHLPLWFTGMGWESMSFGVFLYCCVLMSIILTWICNNTHGNLMLVTLFHLFYNFGLNLMAFVWHIPTDKSILYMAAVLSVYTLMVVIIYGPSKLSKQNSLPIDFVNKKWIKFM